MGDGLLLEFASVVDAVRYAVDVQREMAERNADVPPDRRIDYPIHLPGEYPPFALVKTEFQRGGTGVDYTDQRLCSCCVHANVSLSRGCDSRR